jgi:hypothetical protein
MTSKGVASLGLVVMVESVVVNKVQVRATLVVDTDVWMHTINDFDFAPRFHLTESNLVLSEASDGSELATIALDDEMLEMVERDRSVDLRVKFLVHGFHGHLKDIHPIIADGKAKKLAESRWKSTLSVDMNDGSASASDTVAADGDANAMHPPSP